MSGKLAKTKVKSNQQYLCKVMAPVVIHGRMRSPMNGLILWGDKVTEHYEELKEISVLPLPASE